MTVQQMQCQLGIKRARSFSTIMCISLVLTSLLLIFSFLYNHFNKVEEGNSDQLKRKQLIVNIMTGVAATLSILSAGLAGINISAIGGYLSACHN